MKKTIKKRAFVSAIAMLIVSAIVLTSSTFAWFSMSKEAKIESMDLTVSSPAGIQISANASTWTTNLTLDELFSAKSTSRYKAYDGNANFIPNYDKNGNIVTGDLTPVSTSFEKSDGSGRSEFYRVDLNDEGRVTGITTYDQGSTTAERNTYGFVAFDIFFKLAEAQNVYFGTSEFVDPSSTGILTAFRVGFQIMGNVNSTAEAEDAIALSDSPTVKNTIVYEVDSQNRSGDSSVKTVGKQTTRYITDVSSLLGAKVNSTSYVLETGTTSNPTATVIYDNSSDASKSFSLSAGITKMRVYLWVEGQDIDCRNSVAGAALSAALKFTIA